jgi:hypothetical protein
MATAARKMAMSTRKQRTQSMKAKGRWQRHAKKMAKAHKRRKLLEETIEALTPKPPKSYPDLYATMGKQMGVSRQVAKQINFGYGMFMGFDLGYPGALSQYSITDAQLSHALARLELDAMFKSEAKKEVDVPLP